MFAACRRGDESVTEGLTGVESNPIATEMKAAKYTRMKPDSPVKDLHFRAHDRGQFTYLKAEQRDKFS